jgi:hypothetical protein
MNYKTILASLTALVFAATSSIAQDSHKSGQFQGAKANKGFVTHTTQNGKSTLTLSDDFVPPQTPDPHWQVVDSNGKTYLLDRLMTKDQKVKKSIVVPDYVPDIAKSRCGAPLRRRTSAKPPSTIRSNKSAPGWPRLTNRRPAYSNTLPMKIFTSTQLAIVVAISALAPAHAQVVEKKSLNLEGAKKAIAAAVDYAKKNNAPGE